ncbi:MAG: response regulator [Lachnospiraceae bacterium]|nr:response regulator [Lachnospiraceae bacterium]
MLRLILVEDEPFARNGILSMVPWKELGIDDVIIAEDGDIGYEKALESVPDIILTDVKMPRLNGVEMAFRIRGLFPDCCIIFMSGYADKEYLKSAIRLSAVNYIEKPFSPEELISTLRIAVDKCLTAKALIHSANALTHKLDLSLPVIKNKIALTLLKPVSDQEKLREYLKIIWPDFDSSGGWVTFLVQLFKEQADQLPGTVSMSSAICSLLESRLALSDFAYVIIGEKSEQLIAVHINLKTQSGSLIQYSQIRNICYTFCGILKSACRFLLAVGEPTAHIEQLYTSYQTAFICLQRGFFHRENTVLFPEKDQESPVYQFTDDDLSSFEKILRSSNEEEAFNFITELVKRLRKSDATLVSTVKNFFFSLIQRLYQTSQLYGCPVFAEEETIEALRETLWDMCFLSEIEQYILEKISAFFHAADNNYSQYPLACKLRLFVDENFDHEELTLPLIASHFSVSESYVCVVFKKAFRITINQYMINLRIEKAKDYLINTNKKIKEISVLTGYRDCNYFIRLFKKNTGTTPADYRLYGQPGQE